MNERARLIEGTYREDHDSFLKRFRLKITPDEMARLDYAYDMAKHGHKEQFRESGARYFEHVRAATIILVDELGVTDTEIIISSLLHDMLEDSFLLTPERIKITFGERVATLVSAVTKPKKNDSRFSSDVDRHRWYFAQLKAANPEVKLLKLPDRLQNTRTLGSCSLEKQARKIKETREIYLPLISDIATIYPEQASYLETELNKALAKLEVVEAGAG
jgi:GTP pyrophosphokinase